MSLDSHAKRTCTALLAGIVYFAVVFCAGFVLGTLRTLLVAPAVGEFKAVLLELPLILTFSWLACRSIVRMWLIPSAWVPRLSMAVVAFALLMIAEAGVSIFLFGKSLSQHLEAFATPAGAIGLAGQIAFAAFPLLQIHRQR